VYSRSAPRNALRRPRSGVLRCSASQTANLTISSAKPPISDSKSSLLRSGIYGEPREALRPDSLPCTFEWIVADGFSSLLCKRSRTGVKIRQKSRRKHSAQRTGRIRVSGRM
jgi:hypothetical protein